MKKILIVDGRKESREMLQKALEGSGYVVVEAENIGEAQQALVDNKEIGMVISGMGMTDGDGFSLLKWLQKTGKFGDILFIRQSEIPADQIKDVFLKNKVKKADAYIPAKEGVSAIVTAVEKFMPLLG